MWQYAMTSPLLPTTNSKTTSSTYSLLLLLLLLLWILVVISLAGDHGQRNFLVRCQGERLTRTKLPSTTTTTMKYFAMKSILVYRGKLHTQDSSILSANLDVTILVLGAD